MFDRADGLEFLKLAVENEFQQRRTNIMVQAEDHHKRQVKGLITEEEYQAIIDGLKHQLKDLEALHAVAKALVDEMEAA